MNKKETETIRIRKPYANQLKWSVKKEIDQLVWVTGFRFNDVTTIQSRLTVDCLLLYATVGDISVFDDTKCWDGSM